MKDFRTAIVSLEVINAAMERLGRKYRLIVTAGGQMKLFVVIPPSAKPEAWAARFWEAVTELAGPEGERDPGVQRPFDPAGCRFVTEAQVKEDLLLTHLFHRQKESIELLTPPHLERWNKPEAGAPEPLQNRPARIVFYSYKGGLGRTTTMILCAVALANQGKRVALIDFDLEAPGLVSTLLPPVQTPQRGVVDFLLGFPAINHWDERRLRRYLGRSLQPIEFPNGGSLLIWGAGQVNADYPAKLAHITLEHVHRLPADPVKRMFDLVNRMAEGVDYILIDSRTGLADIGGSLLFQYADVACGFFSLNPQTADGLKVFSAQLARDRQAPGSIAPAVIWVDSHTRPSVQPAADKTGALRTVIKESLRTAPGRGAGQRVAAEEEPVVLRLNFTPLLVDLGPDWFRERAAQIVEGNPDFKDYLALTDRLVQTVAERRQRSLQV